jgi:type II secretory pathway component PulM
MRHFVKLPPLSLAKAFAQRGSLNAPAFLSQIREKLSAIQARYMHQKPHPFLWTALGIALVCIGLTYWILPSVTDLESKLALRPAQWAQLENLIRLSKANSIQVSGIEPMDEAELQRIRMILAAKGIKPSVLRLTLENPPRVELQMSEVVFSSAVDALEELRKAWNLYPEHIEVSATPKIAVVNLTANLKQMGALTGIAGEQSR